MKKRNRPAAFTLIELIIVGAIIVVLVAVSTPLFRRTFKDLELRDAAYNIGKIIQYAQQKAIVEEKKYRLVFYFEKKAYRLFSLSEEKKGETISSWKEITGRFGVYFYLPEGVSFKAGKDKIIFLPNGRCDKISVYIAGKDKAFEIKTNGRTGHVEISEVRTK